MHSFSGRTASILLVATLAAGCAGEAAVHREGLLPSSPVHSGLDSRSPVGINWVFVRVDGYDGELPGPRPQPGFLLGLENSRMAGSTGCNAMSSAFELDVERGALHFRRLNNTRRACPQEMGLKEEAVLGAMIATDGFEMRGDELVLLSKGRSVAMLTNPAAP